MSGYLRREIMRVLNAGPAEGEDWFRVKITGKAETRWLNLTEGQVGALLRAIEEEEGK